jgi:DMSO/TMAO reductase YedYZ molybdopterin-dependent catalytic subunit
MIVRPSRRALLLGASAALAGCDQLSRSEDVQRFIGVGEGLSKTAQRVLLAGQPLAREFKPTDISPVFKVNGSRAPDSEEYQRHAEENFAKWRLIVDGLVRTPLSLSLGDVKALPSRSQITRHDCVEGWSAIGQWKGVRLAALLERAGLAPHARFVVFHCADNLEGGTPNGQYYESIDLFDAFHPQTILAYEMNGAALPVAHGAPLRLRVERQLGYKHAKYVMRVELVNTFDGIRGGRGGYWEDRGYEWYAGI